MKAKKTILTLLCAVALVVTSVLGTIAYLTDSATVSNTFTVGNVDITLDETKVTPDGKEVPGADRVEGNEYHLIPGQTYVKDPTMTISEDSDEAHVRILVSLNKASELKAIFGDSFLGQNYVEGWDNTVWTYTSTVEEDNNIVYEFRYKETVDGTDGQLPAIFTAIKVPAELTKEQLKTLEGFEIEVVGHAIQTAGFTDVNEAWAAFDAQQ